MQANSYPRLELDDNSRIMPVSINGTKPAGTAWTQAEFNEAIIAERLEYIRLYV